MFIIEKKRQVARQRILDSCTKCSGKGCDACFKKHQFIERLADANIPFSYWFLKLKEFNGPENVLLATREYIADIENKYNAGSNICFVGQYGAGKTFSICAILKNVLIKDFSAYYTSLSDMIQHLTSYATQDMFYNLVTKCDFLAIDEVDSRHFSNTDQAQQLFGSTFERVIRYRTQNSLPTIIASNNASLDEVFTGQYKRVIDSLLSQNMTVIPVLGKDYRKNNSGHL